MFSYFPTRKPKNTGLPSNIKVLIEPTATLVTVADFTIGRGSHGMTVN